jgi:RecA-family ATPase
MTKRVKLIRASHVEPKRVRSLMNKRLPVGAVTTCAGPGGLGKSTLLIEIAAKLTRGELQGTKNPQSVVFVSTEDTASEVLLPRLMLAGADTDLVSFPRVTEDGKPAPLTLPDDMEMIEAVMRKSRARLLVLDPFFSMVSTTVNANSDHHVRAMLTPLAELAERLLLVVIIVVHVNKGTHLAVLDRVMGSVGVVNGPRSTLVFARDPHDEDDESSERILAHVKSNWTEKQPSLSVRIKKGIVRAGDGRPIYTSRAVIGDVVNVDANDLLRTSTAEDHGALHVAIDFLRQELADGPLPVAVLNEPKRLKALSISRATLYRARKHLGLVSVNLDVPFGAGERKAWRLP